MITLKPPRSFALLVKPCAGLVAIHSTGVGLANIQDRLTQAYGPAHGFATKANDRGGFSVILEIPVDLPHKDAS